MVNGENMKVKKERKKEREIITIAFILTFYNQIS
jgi:hypothetical protein